MHSEDKEAIEDKESMKFESGYCIFSFMVGKNCV